MIVLDYNAFIECYEDLQSSDDLGSLRGWPDYLEDCWFLGGQIFKVGKADFTTDYPLLGFARHLKAVAIHLAMNPTESYVYFEAGWAVNRQLVFYGYGEDVFIRQGTLIGESRILASARCPLSELNEKASAYLCRVFEYCCTLVPQLKQDSAIKLWINDFSHVTPLESELWKSSNQSQKLYRRPDNCPIE